MSVTFFSSQQLNSAGILEESLGARNRVGTELSYRPARARTFKCLWGPGIDSNPPAYVV
jgi:hypothetical protein